MKKYNKKGKYVKCYIIYASSASHCCLTFIHIFHFLLLQYLWTRINMQFSLGI